MKNELENKSRNEFSVNELNNELNKLNNNTKPQVVEVDFKKISVKMDFIALS